MNETNRGTRAPALRTEAGFSLLELLIASFMSVAVVGGMLVMLNGLQDTHFETQDLIEAQQTARLSLEQMQRDLQLAGVGLAWLLPPYPLVEARADGGIDIRHNQGGLTAAMVADMAGPTAPIVVDDVTGFEAGMNIAVYDAGGAVDMVEVLGVDAANNRISHDGASKAFTVAASSAVARVQVVTYRVLDIAGIQTLVRQEGTAAAQPIAANVAAFNLTYYDDSTPPVAFVPANNIEMLQIRTVEVSLQVQTANTRLNNNQRRSVTLTTRVTPRAVILRGDNG